MIIKVSLKCTNMLRVVVGTMCEVGRRQMGPALASQKLSGHCLRMTSIESGSVSVVLVKRANGRSTLAERTWDRVLRDTSTASIISEALRSGKANVDIPEKALSLDFK